MLYKGFLFLKKKKEMYERRENVAMGAVISLAESDILNKPGMCGTCIVYVMGQPVFCSSLRANQHGCVLRSSNLKQKKEKYFCINFDNS